MDRISKDEFLKRIEYDDIFSSCSDPVRIGDGSSKDLVCMSIDLYNEFMENKTDPYDDIRYYIYELRMPEELRSQFEQKAKDLEMTVDEFFNAALRNFINYVQDCRKRGIPVEKMFSDTEIEPDEEVEFVRCYPVHCGETEAQARKRAVAKEQKEKTGCIE